MMRQASSPAWARSSRSLAARSLYGSTTTSRRTLADWPGYSGIAVGPAGSSFAAGGWTLTATYSWAPWYAPSNLAILGRPVKARAARMAISVPSVPELVKRTVSSEGMRSHRSWARRTWDTVGVLKAVPFAAWAAIPSTSSGWAWPRIRLVALSMKSRYRLPSAS